MKFNLLLYVPALIDNLDIQYGIFIQHHLMDDADIELNYFEFDRINSETYALDIVDKNEVTKKVRKDCLVEGFTLNSHYSIDLDKGFNRSIHGDEVRQIFICFKNNSKDPIDAFIRMTHDGETKNYKIKDNLIIFKLWTAPELKNSANVALNIGKVNYSNFEYFCESIKTEINNQWHAILSKKRDLSKAALLEHNEYYDTQPPPLNAQPLPADDKSPYIVDVPPLPIEAKSTPKAPSNNDFANMFVKQPYEIVDNIRPIPSASKPLKVSEDSYPLSGSKRGSDNFKIIAYILLIIGVLSILGKMF